VGSIYEATNDLSALGMARVFVGLYALLPAMHTLLKVAGKYVADKISKAKDKLTQLLTGEESVQSDSRLSNP